MSKRLSPVFVQFAILTLLGATPAMAMGKKPLQPVPNPNPTWNPGPINVDPGNYPTLSKAFKDPTTILTSTNFNGTLQTLRSIAQPNAQYHSELLQLVMDAKSTDLAHVNLLVDASSFSASENQALLAEIELLWGKTDADSVAKLTQDQKTLSIQTVVGGYVNQIINVGATKASDLNAENGSAILHRLFDGLGNDDDIFNAVFKLLSPQSLDKVPELEFTDFATQKGANRTAGTVALDYFARQQQYTVQGLIELGSRLKDDGKDVLITGGTQLLGNLTAADLLALSKAAKYQRQNVITENMGKISNITIQDIVALAGGVQDDAKDTVVTQGVARIQHPSSSDLLTLSKAAKYQWQNVILNNMARVPNISVQDLIALADGVQDDAKDTVVVQGIARLPAVTTDQLLALSKASKYQRQNVILNNETRISDLSVDNTTRICQVLQDDAKDTFVLAYLKTLGSVSTADLEKLSKASKYQWQNIFLNNLNKVSDLNVGTTVQLAHDVQDDAKDTLVLAALAKFKSVTTDELLQLSAAAKYQWQNILIGSMNKISDLTVANAIRVADNLQDDAKDTFLLAAVVAVTDLNATNLLEMSGHAKYQQQALIAKGKKRLGIP